MSVTIKQLKAFVAVAEEKSFSLAAERLNATQSGMSMLVQNLEISIGKSLIKRIPGNMNTFIPTLSPGKKLLVVAR